MKFINTIKAIVAWLSGKKTYIIAVIIAVIALLQASGVVVPQPVYDLLGALGLGFLRAGVAKV
jgi:hypothetical protein